MKKLSILAKACLLAAGISAVGIANAAQLNTSGGSTLDLTALSDRFDPSWLGSIGDYASRFDLTSVLRGATLQASAPGNLNFTLVGFEAGFNNAFTAGGQRLDNRTGATPLLGASFSLASAAAGSINYGFLSNGVGALFGNGSNSTGLILSNDRTEALVLFNDTYIDRDYDDMVVRVSISPVPEPETIAMLLAGLGVLGAAVRRKKQRQALTNSLV
ncbi:PEP-CTERM sorting domain-containing protein [Hydrogenophaga sp.]|uniref:PEP-CTERM sorting domain-containing protein n=1 Tax=Hydrogenophaga sp. TaxID=1904254 RepID=UPI002625F0E4|nr:PEP-CTERM sorting domain-containing protein [Hydrogenophaga sp.]MDM7948618.1 PEP-CTERM sorting domain-containing protein [Hydrogenophaga sp.]